MSNKDSELEKRFVNQFAQDLLGSTRTIQVIEHYETALTTLLNKQTEEAYQNGYDDRTLEVDHEIEEAKQDSVKRLEGLKIRAKQGLVTDSEANFHNIAIDDAIKTLREKL